MKPTNIFSRTTTRAVLAAALLAIAGTASASTVTVPAGLAPGTQYRLVFVTKDTMEATSTNIATYNNFVTAEADQVQSLAALDTTWTAIVSTPSISAVTNIGDDSSLAAIYNLAGLEVTSSTSGLFNAAKVPLLNRLDFDQFGNFRGAWVWTGSTAAGGIATKNALGDEPPMYGNSVNGYGGYLEFPALKYKNIASMSVYAISGVLTVPASTPEPCTTYLLITGGGLLVAMKRRPWLTR